MIDELRTVSQRQQEANGRLISKPEPLVDQHGEPRRSIETDVLIGEGSCRIEAEPLEQRLGPPREREVSRRRREVGREEVVDDGGDLLRVDGPVLEAVDVYERDRGRGAGDLGVGALTG